MAQLITISLNKGPSASWGFRLQGGKDFAQPLCIQKVNVGSVAESAGLQAGDAIVSIGGSDALLLRHKEAQDTIVKAGSGFSMVVQRGGMSWKPQVTALAQPKKTAEGPVVTQTSLAAPGKQGGKPCPPSPLSQRPPQHPNHQVDPFSIGSNHNCSPKPFPGPGTWAPSSSTPPSRAQSVADFHHLNNITNNNNDDIRNQYYSEENSENRSRSLTKNSSNLNRSNYLMTSSGASSDDVFNNNAPRNHSRSPSRNLSRSPNRHGYDDSSIMTSRSSYNRKTVNDQLSESMDASLEESYKSRSALNNSTTKTYSTTETFSSSTKRSTSSSSLLNRTDGGCQARDLHRASYVATAGNEEYQTSPSPPLPPPPVVRSTTSPQMTTPLRTPSPPFDSSNVAINSRRETSTGGTRSNRSPSPYYNYSNSSRTPASLSPSCSIPSLSSTGSVISVSSLHSPMVRRPSMPDPVADLELKNSLHIDGADISLDKENARNFLKMQLDKERGRDSSSSRLYAPSGSRRVSRSSKDSSYSEEHQFQDRQQSPIRKISQDSPNSYRSCRDSVDSAFISNNNISVASCYTNKSTDNVFSETNPSNISTGVVLTNSSNGSVNQNTNLFDSGRHHSSTVQPPITKYDFRSRTLDRGSNSSTAYRPQSSCGTSVNRYTSNRGYSGTSSHNTTYQDIRPTSDAPGSLRRAPHTSSCSNLLLSEEVPTDAYVGGRGVNYNVPWRNHFSNLRRKSVSSLVYSPPNHRDFFLSSGHRTNNVNGQSIVNPQYNSPISLYNEDNIAEALSSQSEVLGKGCLGVNFKKNDFAMDKDSDVLRMVQEMDRAPKMPHPAPGTTGSSSVYTAVSLTPSEMIGTPEIPIQGASFKILERFLTGEDERGSRPCSGVSSPVPGSSPGGPTRSVQAPVTKLRPEGVPVVGAPTMCVQCERPIIGVFVRIKDKNLHADCFKCNTCGSSLKNVGYYNINDKMYCDVHAKQAAKHNPPAPNMVPVTVKPGAAPPVGALPAAAVAHPALVRPPPPGGVRLFPAPTFGGPAVPYKRPF